MKKETDSGRWKSEKEFGGFALNSWVQLGHLPFRLTRPRFAERLASQVGQVKMRISVITAAKAGGRGLPWCVGIYTLRTIALVGVFSKK